MWSPYISWEKRSSLYIGSTYKYITTTTVRSFKPIHRNKHQSMCKYNNCYNKQQYRNIAGASARRGGLFRRAALRAHVQRTTPHVTTVLARRRCCCRTDPAAVDVIHIRASRMANSIRFFNLDVTYQAFCTDTYRYVCVSCVGMYEVYARRQIV